MTRDYHRYSEEHKVTTNSYVFNKLHKKVLEKKGKIRCSYCAYHRDENEKTNKYYGEIYNWKMKEHVIRYPNWKLVSKKEKQWMNEV